VAVRGARSDTGAVGVGGAGDSGELAVEEDEVLRHGGKDADVGLPCSS